MRDLDRRVRASSAPDVLGRAVDFTNPYGLCEI